MKTETKEIDLQNCSHGHIARMCEHCKHAYEQAEAQLGSIRNMVETLRDAMDDTAAEGLREEAEQAILEDALSVEMRDDWYSSIENQEGPAEFKILLCTGGPAVRLIGTLDQCEPDSVKLEYQDWGTPWTEYRLTSEQEETVLTYCRAFSFDLG